MAFFQLGIISLFKSYLSFKSLLNKCCHFHEAFSFECLSLCISHGFIIYHSTFIVFYGCFSLLLKDVFINLCILYSS